MMCLRSRMFQRYHTPQGEMPQSLRARSLSSRNLKVLLSVCKYIDLQCLSYWEKQISVNVMAFLSYLYSFLHTHHRGLRWCARTSWCPRQYGTTRRWGARSWGELPALQLLSATARLKRSILLSIFFLISNGCCEGYWANVCKLLGNSPMNCALGMLSIAPHGLFLTWSIRD